MALATIRPITVRFKARAKRRSIMWIVIPGEGSTHSPSTGGGIEFGQVALTASAADGRAFQFLPARRQGFARLPTRARSKPHPLSRIAFSGQKHAVELE